MHPNGPSEPIWAYMGPHEPKWAHKGSGEGGGWVGGMWKRNGETKIPNITQHMLKHVNLPVVVLWFLNMKPAACTSQCIDLSSYGGYVKDEPGSLLALVKIILRRCIISRW